MSLRNIHGGHPIAPRQLNDQHLSLCTNAVPKILNSKTNLIPGALAVTGVNLAACLA